jgi:adenine deaminase
MADYNLLLKVALGEAPADLMIKGAQLVNVVTRDIYPVTVGICDDTIAYVDDDARIERTAKRTINAEGKWIAPGLIDSHMHIESTHLTPEFFSDAVVPLGVTTVAQDPHEIANVLGVMGIDYMISASKGLPLRVLTLAPTCVPAVPSVETSGAIIDARDIHDLLQRDDIIGLAEVMDYWGVIHQEERVTDIVLEGRKSGKLITGHIRGLDGPELNTYLAAGVESDHEFLSEAGILYRSRLGMIVEICCTKHRDNIQAAVESWKTRGHLNNVVFVTDDIPPDELIREGHLDRGVRKAIAMGMAPVDAIRAATYAAAQRLRQYDLGQIAPGKIADILVISDLDQFCVSQVITSGQLVAQDGQMLVRVNPSADVPAAAFQSVHLNPPVPSDFAIKAGGTSVNAKVLMKRGRDELKVMPLPVIDGCVRWQSRQGLCLVAVFHRHGCNENKFLALINDTELVEGAIGTTYSHDSHNLVIIGRNELDMAAVAADLIRMGGGYSAALSGNIIGRVALPVAGIMAQADVVSVAEGFQNFSQAADKLGVKTNPVGLLTSLCLPVVPRYRPTDCGLVDVQTKQFIKPFEP